MSDLIASKTIEILEKALVNGLKDYKEKEQWEIDFHNAKLQLISSTRYSDKYLNNINVALSDENIKDLAANLKDKHGYEFENEFYKQIKQKFMENGIPIAVSEYLSNSLFLCVFDFIKQNHPEVYRDICFREFRDLVQEELSKQAERIKRIEQLVFSLQTFNSLSIQIYTPMDLDQKLLSETRNPSIGISFFSIDDEEFQKEFSQKINDECIYVKGRGREETVYSLLNELYRLNEKRKILIVRSENSWEVLRQQNLTGTVLIPWFYSNEIATISGNTNIFVFSEDEPCYQNNVLILRHRIARTVQNSLKEAGMDSQKVYNLVRETHGLYMPIKRKLLAGHIKEAEWVVKLDDSAAKAAMLMGSWEETEGDIQIAEKLSGMNYDEFISKLRPFSEGEEPFIHVIHRHGKTYFYIADAEYAWSCKTIYPEETIWKTFMDCLLRVVSEVEKQFTYSYAEMINAQLHGETPYWSKILRNGMLKALLMQTFYAGNKRCEDEAVRATERILNSIDTETKWKYIAEFFKLLTEIAPESSLKCLERELEKSTGLFALFEHQPENSLFEKMDYVEILWGIEQLLLIKEYSSRAFAILLKIDSRNYLYRSNSVQEIIKIVLNPAINGSAINKAYEKYSLAIKMFENDQYAWDRLYDSLLYNANYFLPLYVPHYRAYSEITTVPISEAYELNTKYVDLLLQYTNFEVNRWEKLIDYSKKLDVSNRVHIIEELKTALSCMEDSEKEAIRDKLTDLISKNRYHAAAEWSLDEEHLKPYVELRNFIEFDAPEYGYVYLFRNDFDRKPLNPIPYSSGDGRSTFEANWALFDNDIKQKINEFQKRDLSLEKLAELCAGKYDNNSLGKCIAEYWKPNNYNEAIAKMLFRIQKSGIMGMDYLSGYSQPSNMILEEMIDYLEKERYPEEAIIRLYEYDASNCVDKEPLIAKASDELQRLFWKQGCYWFKGKYRWAVNHCRKYGDFKAYTTVLYYAITDGEIREEELFGLFNDIEKIPFDSNRCDPYPFKELLNKLQNISKKKEDCISRIAEIECYFSEMLDETEMKCLKTLLQENPEYYIQLCLPLFRKDYVQGKSKDETDAIIGHYYSIYFKMHFCPVERNGKVDGEALRDWCEKFQMLCSEYRLDDKYDHLLGRVLANSPVGEDGYEPCETIRTLIEERNSEDLKSAYSTTVFNKRGTYTANAGKGEKVLAEHYKEIADHLYISWPVTASIYYGLCKRYLFDSDEERKEAEYEFLL